MKRFLTVLLSLFLGATALAFAACADNAPNGNASSDGSGQTALEEPDTPVGPGESDIPENSGTPNTPGTPGTDSNILIVYFSATGNTARLANYIHGRIGGDLIEIQPEVPYTSQDLNYSTPNMRPEIEHDTNARPAISQETYDAIDIGQYDTILVGYPIWWWTAPMIIGTFLNHYEWTAEDNIYPFTQSASMNNTHFETSMQFVRENAAGATVHDGLFARASSTSAIDAYLTANGLM